MSLFPQSQTPVPLKLHPMRLVLILYHYRTFFEILSLKGLFGNHFICLAFHFKYFFQHFYNIQRKTSKSNHCILYSIPLKLSLSVFVWKYWSLRFWGFESLSPFVLCPLESFCFCLKILVWSAVYPNSTSCSLSSLANLRNSKNKTNTPWTKKNNES